MEQRIGRVHRLGGRALGKKKVEVVLLYQEGTYEALMASEFRTLQDAFACSSARGVVDQDEEIEDVERYRMSFPP